MLIECLLRDGPTTIDKERMRYQFKRDSAGRYVCRINHPAHRAQLLASGAAYLVVDEQVEPEEIDELVENVETLIRTLAADDPNLKATDLAKMLESQFSVKVTWQKIASILR